MAQMRKTQVRAKMTEPAIQDFDGLRAEAIAAAQAASGKVWTDYNVHDPGVTLLEQTCFAYTSLIYQARQSLGALLTDAGGQFAGGEMSSLHRGAQQFQACPVQPHDLEARLRSVPGVYAAWVEQDFRGQVTAFIVPEAQTGQDDLLAEVREAFARVRPLCNVLRAVEIAQVQTLALVGQVDILPGVDTVQVAAALYRAASDLVQAAAGSGRTLDQLQQDLGRVATAEGLADAPDLHFVLEHSVTAPMGVSAFRLQMPWELWGQVSARGAWQGVEAGAAAPTIILRDRGLQVNWDSGLVAHAVAARGGQNGDQGPGARGPLPEFPTGTPLASSFDHVDMHLPPAYPAHWRDRDLKSLAAQYRAAINAYVQGAYQDLQSLPQVFDPDVPWPAKDSSLPRHEQQVARLDHALALLGEVMPDAQATHLNFYRTVSEARTFALTWRQRLLDQAADLNANRGVGPDPAQDRPGGFLSKLCLLADLPILSLSDQSSGPCAHLARWGLCLGDPSTQTIQAAQDLSDFTLPADPLLALPAVDPAAEVLDVEAFLAANAWLPQDEPAQPRTLTLEQFVHAAQPQAFAVVQGNTPAGGAGWAVVFEVQEGQAPLLCRWCDDLDTAHATLQSLRATWRQLHQACEAAYVVEDICLGGPFRPHRAWLAVTGWTARTRQASYRAHVADLVAQHSPAHVRVQIHWLDFTQAQVFEAHVAAALRAEPLAAERMRTILTNGDGQ